MVNYPPIYHCLNYVNKHIKSILDKVDEKVMRDVYHSFEFLPYIQPIFNHKKKLSGCEILLRMKKDNHLYGPNKIIEHFEAHDLINEITIKLISDISSAFKDCAAKLPKDFYFSFNITGKQLQSKIVTDAVKMFSREFAHKATILLEIVEREHLNINEEVIDIVDDLMAEGVRFAIDDFGSGTSSLKYLEHVGFSVIKLDKSLTVSSHNELVYKNLIKAMVTLSNSLNIKLIAEGVENIRQMELLTDEGVCDMQGFYLAKPMDIQKFKKQINI